MNNSKGRLYYATGIDNSKLRSDAEESRNILHSIGQTAKQEGASMDNTFGKIAKAAGGVFAISKAQEFAKEIVKVRGEIESLQISFETLLGGNKEKANAMFGEIRQFAVQTPMMLKDLAAGAQTMLGFNIEAEKVVPMLKAIGDISMGDAGKFNSLTLAFSQMSATGKLMGQDLLQMINAGFNPLAVISEKTGKSIGDLKEEVEKGRISVEMVTDAFISATSAGGKYYGMLEKQSHGINGAVSNLQGAFDDMYNGIGESSQGIITGALNGATNLVKHYEEVAEILGVIIGTYGVYKAAVITNEALIRSAMVAKGAAVQEAFDSEIEALSALLPEKETEAQTSLQQAVASGQLSEAKAAEIAMLRAEAEAQMESLAATEAAARNRMIAAQADIQAAAEWEKQIQSKIDALEKEADALFESGDSIAFNAKQEEIAALQSELLEIQKEKETAAQEVNTAANEMNAAAHQQNAIATAQESAATEINTAQTTTNTGATSALSIAKTKLAGVVKTLYATISAHPYALAAAAVVALGYGIFKLITYQTNAEKAQKRLDDAFAKSSGAIASEEVKIKYLFSNLKQAKEGTEEYEKAKNKIIDQYGNYLNGLNSEISTLKDVEGAYKAITEAAKESARARAMESYVQKEQEEYASQYEERLKKIKKAIAKKKGEDYADLINDDIIDVISGKKKWSDDFIKQFDEIRTISGSQYAPAYTYTTNILKSLTDEAQKGEKEFEKIIQNAESKFGIKRKKNERGDDGDGEKEIVQNKKYWEQKKKDAEAELETLSDIEAKGQKGEALRTKIRGYNKKLGLYSASSDEKSSNVNKDNADMLANEAANRRKQEEEYAKKIADQVIDSEFEIRQARIDAMKDGIDKELAQNELNYDLLKEQNKRRERDLLNDLADQEIRLQEDADPTMFKKKGKDGKLEEDPGKRDEKYREIRMKLTIDDLDDTQKAQLREYGEIASLAFEKANKDSLDKMLQDVQTYEEQRTKISEDYTRKRQDLYEKNEDGSIKTDADGKQILRKGSSQGNLDELNRQEEEALKAIDEQFAQREVSYQAWCEAIGNLSLKQLEVVLENAKQELEALEKDESVDSKKLATARAKVNKAQDTVNKANAKNETSPGKRTIKEWEDLYKTLNDVEKEFESIGDTVGGVVGDIISECGQFTTSTLAMINGIVQLTNMSSESIKGTAVAGATAISTMEKASVILTVISAAMQIAMQIVNLFNSDASKQKEIERLQTQIDQLQWELDHQEIGKVQAQYGTAISRINKALAESRLELARSATGWQRFVILSQSASRNTELMQTAVDKLAKGYANVAYSADKALGEAKYGDAYNQLQNISKQQLLIQEQINAESSKKKKDNDAIKEWEQKIEELGQQAIEIINELVEDIMGDTASGISNQLADAFFDAFSAGEDAAKAWGDKVNDIVSDILKRMLVSKFLEEPLGDLFDKYKARWFKDGEFQGVDSVINSMDEFSADLRGTYNTFNAAMQVLPEELKQMIMGSSTTSQSATYGGYETLSEDTGQELNGRFSAMQLALELVGVDLKIVKEEIGYIHLISSDILEATKEIRDMLPTIMNGVIDIANNTSELLTIKELLEKIEKSTRNL